MSPAQFYGLNLKEAFDLITLFKRRASSWSINATRIGISRREQDEMSTAFER